MKMTKGKKAALALVLSTLLALPARAADIVFVTEEYAPFNYSENGAVKGIAVEQVHRMATAAHLSYAIEIMPWARAIMLAERQPDHCVFTTAHSLERHERFQWVEPLLRDQMVMLKRKGRNLAATTLQQARALRVGSQRGDIGHEVLMRHGFADIDLATDIAITLGKLKSGRIDLMPTSVKTFDTLSAAGEPIEKAMLLDGLVYGIACNKDVPQAKVAAMQQALDVLIASGGQDAIFAQYGLPPNAAQR